VAVGLERAHAKFVGESEGLLVVGFGLAVLWWLAPRRNVAQEAQSIRLVAAFLALMGKCQRPVGEGIRLLADGQPAGEPPPGRGHRVPDSLPFPWQSPVPAPA
jgi:hypothetical protein